MLQGPVFVCSCRCWLWRSLLLRPTHNRMRPEPSRVVPRDAETMVSSASQWRTHEGEAQKQCMPNGIPALQLVTPPKHGTVRFVVADLGIPKGSECINSVYGQAVMYRPDPRFVGKDQFTYNVPVDPTAFEHFGRPAGPWIVFVTVR